MRPLPSYNAKPVKKHASIRSAARAGIAEVAASVTEAMSVRSGRLAIRPATVRGKPQLKVLGRD